MIRSAGLRMSARGTRCRGCSSCRSAAARFQSGCSPGAGRYSWRGRRGGPVPRSRRSMRPPAKNGSSDGRRARASEDRMAIRMGVVGVAGVGRAHLERARRNERAELVGLADVDPAARERAAGEFGVPGYASQAELLERARPEAVVLATPPLSHRPLTEEAAAAGVHVLCEKPMAPSLPDCGAMIEACRRAGVTLMLGHKKRFAPALVRLRQLIDAELGAPGFFIYRYPHPGSSERDWFWD